jgi:type I restriction enzyme R subunit
MYGELPSLFKSEIALRKIWSNPTTREAFLSKISELGYDKEKLETLQKLINAENSDLFDVLAYVSFALKPISREERVINAKRAIFNQLNEKQKEFISFVLSKYIDEGVEELSENKLPKLINLKYQSVSDAEVELGSVEKIRTIFIDFQKYLYAQHKQKSRLSMMFARR